MWEREVLTFSLTLCKTENDHISKNGYKQTSSSQATIVTSPFSQVSISGDMDLTMSHIAIAYT